jgi:hypothetical protein
MSESRFETVLQLPTAETPAPTVNWDEISESSSVAFSKLVFLADKIAFFALSRS